MDTFYSRKDGKEYELLINHLNMVSNLCGKYMEIFNAPNIGKTVGFFHDLGKHTKRFQEVLFGNTIKINHAKVGAFCLNKLYPFLNGDIPLIIASHHTGLSFEWLLKDNINIDTKDEDSFKYIDFTDKKISLSSEKELVDILCLIKNNNFCKNQELSILLKNEYDSLFDSCISTNQRMLITRVLFSCLVDADYSASATFSDTNYLFKTKQRELSPQKLQESLYTYRKNIISTNNKNIASSNSMNELRNHVFDKCMQIAQIKNNNFKLTAPTGTAKTLALLGFSLEHAKIYNKNKIIIVLPFLSIIDQTTQIYKDICGEDNVFEDTSKTIFTEETRELSNVWSYPIIITTSVKFFEMLFKNNGPDLRKLHNICNSVVIFDEAQTLPINLIDATLETIETLNNKFNVTTVFSTATQPNFNYRKNVYWNALEIIEDTQNIYDKYALARPLNVEWSINTQTSWNEILGKVENLDSFLIIVNLKKHAIIMYELLVNASGNSEDIFFISTDMCIKHRQIVIDTIKKRQSKHLPCKVVSTQCIEAGVDLDFPYVLRALAPAESIIQSIGRCNRNGLTIGKVTIFIPEGDKIYPTAHYKNSALQVLQTIKLNNEFDINNLSHIDKYYQLLFTTKGEDKDKVELTNAIENYDYCNVEKNYKLIDDSGVTIIVPYINCMKEYNEIKKEIESYNFIIPKSIMKTIMKKSAFFTVSTYIKEKDLKNNGLKEIKIKGIDGKGIHCGWYFLDIELNCYDDKVGLTFKNEVDSFIF